VAGGPLVRLAELRIRSEFRKNCQRPLKEYAGRLLAVREHGGRSTTRQPGVPGNDGETCPGPRITRAVSPPPKCSDASSRKKVIHHDHAVGVIHVEGNMLRLKIGPAEAAERRANSPMIGWKAAGTTLNDICGKKELRGDDAAGQTAEKRL